jgi:uncharacterized membrane protein (UPF0127 family)
MLRAAMLASLIGFQVVAHLHLKDRDVIFETLQDATTTVSPMEDTMAEPVTLPQFRDDATLTVVTDGTTYQLKTEIPDCYPKFMEGLMWRREMCDDCAMLFKWEEQQPQLSFWMEHTPLPLDIIYVNANGEVVSVKPLSPGDKHGVGSDLPAIMAVEVKQGMAGQMGIQAGKSRINLPDQLPQSAFVCAYVNCPLMQR